MVDLGPEPTPEEKEILKAYRNQTPYIEDGNRVLITSAEYVERGSGMVALHYTYRSWED